MKKIHLLTAVYLVISVAALPAALAKGAKQHVSDATLGVDMVGMKAKGSWTAVVLALENHGTQDAEFECCQVFLENGAGYAVAALTRDEMQVLIHNKAKTAAMIGGLIGAGLGIAGSVANIDELVYAGIGVGVTSGVAGVVGGASAEKEARNFVIDDIMRARNFPAGLKVAGVVYFPPKKKWPDSKDAKAIHVTYKIGGKQQRVTLPLAQ